MDLLFVVIGLVVFFIALVLPVALLARVSRVERQVSTLLQDFHKMHAELASLKAVFADKSASPDTDTDAAEASDTADRRKSAARPSGALEEADEPQSPNMDFQIGPWRAEKPTKATGISEEEKTVPSVAASVSEAEPQASASIVKEQTIGARWSIWVGGVTLAIGGIFLVKYAVDHGVLGPLPRILIGALLGMVLLVGGEWSRRQPRRFKVPGYDNANIPATLTASGTLVLFGSVFAAHALYGLIGSFAAFVLLGLLAFSAMLTALLHGPALATLGLLGSYVVPFLISSRSSDILPLVIYVLAVSAAAVAIGRFRSWLWFAGAAVGGLFLYAGLMEVSAGPGERLLLNIFFAGALMIVYGGFVWRVHAVDPAHPMPVDRAATVALSIFALPMLGQMQFQHSVSASGFEVAMLLLLPFALAYVHTALRYAIFVPLICALIHVFQFQAELDITALMDGADGLARVISPLPSEATDALIEFVSFVLFFGVLVFLLGILGSARSAGRAVIASGAVLATSGLFAIAYLRIESWQVSITFAALSLALGLLYFAIAERYKDELSNALGGTECLSAWLIGGLFAFTFSATLAFEKAALTVALGLLVPAVMLAYLRYPLPQLRVLTPLAVIPYALRLQWDPFIVVDTLGTTPVFNALLYGYGVPCAGFIVSAVVMTTKKQDRWSEAMQAIAIFALALTLSMLSLHAVDPMFRFGDPGTRFQGSAMLILVGAGLSLALTCFLPGKRQSVLEAMAMALSVGGMVIGGYSLFLINNPVLTGQSVGTGVIINWVTFAYGVPCILFGLLSLASRGCRPSWYTKTVFVFAVLFGFFFINLTIRNSFSPDDLTTAPIRDLEQYVYSLVWLSIGVLCLLAGLKLDQLRVRQASGGIIAVVVFKVFLIDMSALEGVLRAMSFIGLGLTLIGIGYLYQRMILRTSALQPETDPADETALR
ncbi:DUF2339 domain-containing protein [Roseibium alexandrii]|uniref:Putative membrane protein n=1 Tax=Roseibium alexandrii (strain DSM 17067 / NCIMB 14079 / DFL-11) TaxID=244592 RepID=A0A5E8GT28_ROSAD|nr:DUF2339 domain-containing protein [Roseibium alexandrii]EEE42992.2 putative membrane protein [Roseibium alexandrii DFL-11]